jgi:putative oxidoreductase
MAKRSYFVKDTPNVLLLRLTVGAVFIMHGGRTIFINSIPWFAGYLGGLGVPYPLYFAVLVSIVEFAGGIALAVGFYPRAAALFLSIDMVTAFFFVHMKKGFFVTDGGYEFVVVLFVACLVFVIGPPARVLRM